MSAFLAGFAHPMLGPDHLVAMVAVGLWAARLGGRARWALPASFVGFMLVGALLATPGVPLPASEQIIVASVFVLGLAVLTAVKLPAWLAAAFVATFALFHGHAHGIESAGDPFFLAGVLFTTALLHGVGLALGLGLTRVNEWLPRSLGGVALAVGAWLMLS